VRIDLLESVQVSNVEVLVDLSEGSEFVSEAANCSKLADLVLVVPSTSLSLVSILVDGIKVSWNSILPQSLVS
jgi:hypothetical protein